MKKPRKVTLKQAFPIILLVGGLIGIFCAGILTTEKIQLIEHPHSQLSCDLNPIIACGSVINTKQAAAFGFPNPMLGLVGFAAVATVGGAILAGAAFKRWFWLAFQAGVTFAVGFVTWLQFETIFRIKALCPYCMLTWTVTIPIFIYTTMYNLRENNIVVSKNSKLKPIANFIERHHLDILIAWYLIIIAVILQHFWYYWKTII